MLRIWLALFCLLLLPGPVHALGVEVEVGDYRSGSDPAYGPAHLTDGDLSTAWVGTSPTGRGEWIELHFAEPIQVERLGITNGCPGDDFKRFRRIRSGRIIYPDGRAFRFWLGDRSEEQTVYCLGAPTDSLRIEIDSVFPGARDAFSGPLAITEIRLFISETPREPGEVNDVNALNQVRTHLAEDPERGAPSEVSRLLRQFYYRQATLADTYADLFAEDVRDKNDFQFEVFKEMQRQRGTYKLLRNAKVNVSSLCFEKLEQAGAYMRVRAFGAYSIRAGKLDRRLEEDSVFVVTRENGYWKILELEE